MRKVKCQNTVFSILLTITQGERVERNHVFDGGRVGGLHSGMAHRSCIYRVALLMETLPLPLRQPPDPSAQRLFWRKEILNKFNEIIKEDEVYESAL